MNTIKHNEQLPAYVAKAAKKHCEFFGMDPDELVDAAQLTRRPEGETEPPPPQMVPRWQIHQQMVHSYLVNHYAYQCAWAETFANPPV